MSKEYVCDSCGKVLMFPHEVRMKEFFVNHSLDDVIGFVPYHDRRRIKKHICDRCFLKLGEVTHNTQQEWIPVRIVPKEDGKYLVHKNLFGTSVVSTIHFAKNGEKVCAYDLKGKKNVWYDYDSETGYFPVNSVTHWMPLPEPPKGE